MSKFWDFLAGGAGKLVESIGGVVDEFHLSKEEKEEFKLKVQQLVLADRQMTEETVRAELDAKAGIIKAELQQEDPYTKRARPTVVYTGLGVIVVNYALFPILYWLIQVIAWMNEAVMFDFPPQPLLELPGEFWWAFTTVVSIYGVGRTVEKRGVSNAFTDIAEVMGTGRLKR